VLQAVKDYLKITWDDEDGSLQTIIERGKAYLNDLVGAELDFDVAGPPRSLLLDYCRYVYNNASEYFEENFASELLRLQLQMGVKALGSSETSG
jgi:hypothetical protein